MLLGVRISDTSTLRGRGLSEAETEGDIDTSVKGIGGKAGLSSWCAMPADGDRERMDTDERCVLATLKAGDLGVATEDALVSDAVLDPLVCDIGEAGAALEGPLASDGVLDARVWGKGEGGAATDPELASDGVLDART